MDEDHKHPDNAHQQSSLRWLELKVTDKNVSTAIGVFWSPPFSFS